MFIDNKYTKWYNNIITYRKINKPIGYTEKHHIIPKCIGGLDDKSNLVELTAREHYICHLLLTKMIIDNTKINYAFIAMVNLTNDKQDRTYKISSKLYEYSKKINAMETSNRFKGVSRRKGGKLAHNPKTMEECIVYDEILPSGFLYGMSETRRNKVGKSNKNKKYYYEPNTLHVIAIDSTDTPPDGYIKGNPNAKTNLNKVGRVSYYDTINKKIVRKFIEEKLDTDIKVKIIKIYNPTTDIEAIITEYEKVPDGWVVGRKKFKKSLKVDIFNTPFGLYSHILRFCEERDIDISNFKYMNKPFNKNAKNIDKLINDLEKLGLDTNKTKLELNFYKIKDKHK